MVSAHDEPEGDPSSWFVYAYLPFLLLLLPTHFSAAMSRRLIAQQTLALYPHCRKLYGHAENDQWDLLLSVDAHKFDERLETVVFPISPKQNGQYSQFKLLITKIRDADKADHVHLAELTLEGMPAPSPPETGIDWRHPILPASWYLERTYKTLTPLPPLPPLPPLLHSLC